MLDLKRLRQLKPTIITLGSHSGIIQSILDFDYLADKVEPSVAGIIASSRKFERYFWGSRDVVIPVYSSLASLPDTLRAKVNLFLNVSSGRRTRASTIAAFEQLPALVGGVLFAEDVPEKHAIAIYQEAQQRHKFVIGPASVGLLLPGHLKLGAIGGVEAQQLVDSHLFTRGNVATFSSSGGMTGELIRILTSRGKYLSFALSFGGDRFPVTTPQAAFLAAQADPHTDYIVYFGELGGYDEYELVDLIRGKKVTKPVIAYIAGTISDIFETPPQFGHAKAMAKHGEESAKAKREALRQAGAQVGDSFQAFIEMVKAIKSPAMVEAAFTAALDKINNRRHVLFINSISQDRAGVPFVLGEELLPFAQIHSYAYIVGSMLLGQKLKSKELEQFIDLVLKLVVDHGPYVSGAVNTMITARAGKDLVSSLVAGLLTIGPRFGGAINAAAQNWLTAIATNTSAYDFVEAFAQQRKLIAGIGHRKYRSDNPDPRLKALLQSKTKLKKAQFTTFALAVEKITTAKKGNLILNVDGAIAAVMLDLLAEKEGYTLAELQSLAETEFFNAFFVLARAVGLTAHYLDQRRHDEGLFRLSPDDIANV